MIRPLVLGVLLAWLPAAQAQLPQPVSELLAAARIPETAVSVLVLRGDDALVSHLAERQMQPASVIKVVTTLVALEQLGLGEQDVDIEILSDAGPDEGDEALVRVTAKGMASQPIPRGSARPIAFRSYDSFSAG